MAMSRQLPNSHPPNDVCTASLLFLAEVEQPSLDGATRWWRPETCPWLAAEFGLAECPEPATIPPDPAYRAAWERWVRTVWQPRTRANARDSDGTAWIGSTKSSGYRATAMACEALGRPFLVVPEGPEAGRTLLNWIERHRVRVLNCAGNRESVLPGIGERAEHFLAEAFGGWRAADRPGDSPSGRQVRARRPG